MSKFRVRQDPKDGFLEINCGIEDDISFLFENSEWSPVFQFEFVRPSADQPIGSDTIGSERIAAFQENGLEAPTHKLKGEFLNNSEHTIRVGEDYQAVIPVSSKGFDVSGVSSLQWSPILDEIKANQCLLAMKQALLRSLQPGDVVRFVRNSRADGRPVSSFAVVLLPVETGRGTVAVLDGDKRIDISLKQCWPSNLIPCCPSLETLHHLISERSTQGLDEFQAMQLALDETAVLRSPNCAGKYPHLRHWRSLEINIIIKQLRRSVILPYGAYKRSSTFATNRKNELAWWRLFRDLNAELMLECVELVDLQQFLYLLNDILEATVLEEKQFLRTVFSKCSKIHKLLHLSERLKGSAEPIASRRGRSPVIEDVSMCESVDEEMIVESRRNDSPGAENVEEDWLVSAASNEEQQVDIPHVDNSTESATTDGPEKRFKIRFSPGSIGHNKTRLWLRLGSFNCRLKAGHYGGAEALSAMLGATGLAVKQVAEVRSLLEVQDGLKRPEFAEVNVGDKLVGVDGLSMLNKSLLWVCKCIVDKLDAPVVELEFVRLPVTQNSPTCPIDAPAVSAAASASPVNEKKRSNHLEAEEESSKRESSDVSELKSKLFQGALVFAKQRREITVSYEAQVVAVTDEKVQVRWTNGSKEWLPLDPNLIELRVELAGKRRRRSA